MLTSVNNTSLCSRAQGSHPIRVTCYQWKNRMLLVEILDAGARNAFAWSCALIGLGDRSPSIPDAYTRVRGSEIRCDLLIAPRASVPKACSSRYTNPKLSMSSYRELGYTTLWQYTYTGYRMTCQFYLSLRSGQ